MNQPPGDPYGGTARPGGTVVGAPLDEVVAPPAAAPAGGRPPVQPTMVDNTFGSPPPIGAAPMGAAPMAMGAAPMAMGAPMGMPAPAMSPYAPPPQYGIPATAPMNPPLGAPYGVAPAPYARRQKSNTGMIAAVLVGGIAIIGVVVAVAAVSHNRSSDSGPTDSSPIVALPPPVTVEPTDTAAPTDTTPPPEIPTTTATPPKTYPTTTSKPPPTTTTTSKPPPTTTTTSKPPPTTTTTAKPPATTPTTTSTTPSKPPGGRPPAIKIKR